MKFYGILAFILSFVADGGAQSSSSVLIGPDPASRPLAPSTYVGVPISSGVRERTDKAIEALRADYTNEFAPGLTYVNGVPVVMLVTEAGEGAVKQGRRRQAIAAGLEVLLADDSFDQVRICVISTGKKNPAKQTVASYEIARGAYRDHVKSLVPGAVARTAAVGLKKDSALAAALLQRLGID